MYLIHLANLVSRNLYHFVALNNVLTVHRMADRAILSKYKHFSTLWSQVEVKSSTILTSSQTMGSAWGLRLCTGSERARCGMCRLWALSREMFSQLFDEQVYALGV